ncbi:NAD(P)H-binding protein [Streptomyces sp. NPDC020801]|uniref:NAD(P)H-binding protein n=1 Tax=unclassified Streptomyces TaxID=2593676 RepID=UPI003791CA88
MTILVTGATGNVGRHVVDRLVAAGRGVRALTRDPGAAAFPACVEVVRGDLARPRTLQAALRGVDRMYLFPVADTAPEVMAAVKDAGVRRIVVLSSDAVTDGTDIAHHLPVERAVEASGIAWTHVRPGEFALNKLSIWARSIRAEGVVRAAYPGARGVPVHEKDIAAVAVAALLEDGHEGATYSVTGPQSLTQREQVRAIGAGIGRTIRFEEVTPRQARDDMVRQGFPPQIADYVLAFQAKWAKEPATVDPAVERVTGRPARTLAQWAADHVADLC